MGDNLNHQEREEEPEPEPLHFVVIVLGDVGRSPRMQYHALSLLNLGNHVHVSLVGYRGEDLIDELQQYQLPSLQERFHVIRFHVPATPNALAKIRPLYFLWRVITISLWLLRALFFSVPSAPAITAVLVQNPPALPLLAIAALFCFRKGQTQQQQQRRRRRRRQPRMIIDWHNLGYSMLDSTILRAVVKAYEFRVARFADGHLTVTQAMKNYFLMQQTHLVKDNPQGAVQVLHDCPPSLFRPLSLAEQHEVLSKLHADLCRTIPRSWTLIQSLDPAVETILTTTTGTDKNSQPIIQPRQGRPALVTSSTSWTPDEDFGLLLAALVQLDTTITKHESTLTVLVVVTGKGPQKEMYMEQMSKLSLSAVAIQTVWLEPGDYPKLLACADVAVSLHTSTSGLDLPMKILDSFGCHVPVCARDFACLSELVEDHHNGRVFTSSQELSQQLWELLLPLEAQQQQQQSRRIAAAPHSFGALAEYSKNLEGRKRWQDNWTEHALPVLLNNDHED